MFIPKNRKTAIAYDRNRHTLIEKSSDKDHLELDDEKSKEMNVNNTIVSIKGSTDRKVARRKTSVRPSKGYAESTDSEVENSDSDFDDTNEMGGCKLARKFMSIEKSKDISEFSKSDATAKFLSSELNASRKQKDSMGKILIDNCKSPKDSDHNESFQRHERRRSEHKSEKKGKYSEENHNDTSSEANEKRQSSSPLRPAEADTNSNWEEPLDWRCGFAMDY
jgi:hypothetical protein